MRQFLELLEQIGDLRKDIEDRLQKAHRSFLMALSVMDRQKMESAMM
ncbi:MAG: V-type synthase subunit, partial [Candidatus Poribacteria bacterium]|nr:V-type synthase subunit [Candidatus Poribacteria bacterium]